MSLTSPRSVRWGPGVSLTSPRDSAARVWGEDGRVDGVRNDADRVWVQRGAQRCVLLAEIKPEHVTVLTGVSRTTSSHRFLRRV